MNDSWVIKFIKEEDDEEENRIHWIRNYGEAHGQESFEGRVLYRRL